MKQELTDKIIEIYEEWLLDYASDEIHCKDQLIDASENQLYWDEFIEQIKDGE